ncbi:MAG TPA: hypothetical protein VFX15_09925 [Actinomycetes bacterium]|nr:hypothetical protein [Actinomycetes bacterium]
MVSTSCGPAPDSASPNASTLPTEVSAHREGAGGHGAGAKDVTTLYIWASDQARVAPDFLAVIDFDRRSADYGKVLKTVPLPPPGNIGNEPHHCHASVDQTILACGGLLSVVKGQNDIFFFDISDARNPKFLRSTHAPSSSITDDFLPMPGGGFLVTNMGSASGGAGGRVVEFDKDLNLVAEHPSVLPADGGFNPHGIDADFSRNRLVTSDFINPVTKRQLVRHGRRQPARGHPGARRHAGAPHEAAEWATRHHGDTHGAPGGDARHLEPEEVQTALRRELRQGHGTALRPPDARRQAARGDRLFPQPG